MARLDAFLRGRAQAYRATFETPAGQKVLRDLAQFCRADRSTFHADARLHAVLEGRREVWLRIQKHFGLSEAELLRLYGISED